MSTFSPDYEDIDESYSDRVAAGAFNYYVQADDDLDDSENGDYTPHRQQQSQDIHHSSWSPIVEKKSAITPNIDAFTSSDKLELKKSKSDLSRRVDVMVGSTTSGGNNNSIQSENLIE